jgi:hypothetical protein
MTPSRVTHYVYRGHAPTGRTPAMRVGIVLDGFIEHLYSLCHELKRTCYD